MRLSPRAGFTLLELMVVLAVAAILAALGLASLQGVGDRTAALGAANDLQSVLNLARARAYERGVDVWVIVYPEGQRDGPSDGGGAYFVYEDRSGQFGAADGGAPDGGLSYAQFAPPSRLRPTAGVAEGVLVEERYLADYSRRAGVHFGVNPALASFSAPFAMDAGTCSFCTGTPARGAIVFSGDGTTRFVDASGALVAERAASLGIVDAAQARAYLFGISAPTSFVGTYGP
ncbi:prepilin-type N-terminal cleavage/methylation domain-containing protein [Aggregicoccus sp. 17bor-14]|uniref:pilus assembly FimT family protein n=1 Tax=Myxococcaceae TaxID=31 RepID=UPI00129D0D2B|nr:MULTISPECIES: prepilin-type N-terminal cleavage/methylation domain-containing protein [Myxococcaceae]MBF5042818.1 prepilin-type N-terminal cleavage/methylation domain-containing protein [Simulacricoccus sp. 17bor-14]MRI88586.1 prepilin-type N-terminal cleavage/methylation domain-containing protein [Aggregicoccus sp. 17bor-14]